MFVKAKWIWKAGEILSDEFVDFVAEFDATGKSPYTLTIAADSNYTVYLNGELAAFGQYADYPTYKVCDRIDVSKFVKAGTNRLVIVVWYYGDNTQTYIHGDPGVIFELTEQDAPICYSDENTLSRLSRDYISHVRQLISGQLGYTYHYDNTAYDGFIEQNVIDGFAPSVHMPMISTDFSCRPIKMLELAPRAQAQICLQGLFDYVEKQHTRPDIMMQNAALRHRYPEAISDIRGFFGFDKPVHFKTEDQAQGIFFIVDLGQEWAGFLDFDIEVDHECNIEIGYGEHLADGRCRTSVRGFSADFKAKKGRNQYLHTFRRFGCRYVQFFVNATEFTVHYAGLRPTLYPVTAKKFDKGNLLQNTIYEVCTNTLLQCMHEHYEDCPWREQALYCMDSRNQMLCGYYAFDEKEFPRANLKLISKGLRSDGILTICYPSGLDFPIPSFSAVYFIQMEEYIRYTGDLSLAKECYPVLDTIIHTFMSKMQENGLIENFYGDGGYWNFYEWSPGMNGHFFEKVRCFEAPINAFFSLALQHMAKICDAIEKPDEAEQYRNLSASINTAIAREFFNPETLLFESFDNRCRGEYSVLTNALCMLCGAADTVDKTNILRILATNGKDTCGYTVHPNTLSMNSFRFDALLAYDREAYKQIILDEIDKDYFYMLRNGATAFWETIVGLSDFGHAASLCHGWSALPIYYYETLL